MGIELATEYGPSAKEDRDYLLDYKSVDLSTLGRLDILGCPIDNLSRDEAVAVILHFLETSQESRYFSFLDPIKLMQLRRTIKIPGESAPTSKKKESYSVSDFHLCLADGAGLQWAARKLGFPLKERIPMMALLMDIVRLAEKMELTIYLLGRRMERVERAFFNLQKSFPGVRIVGRQGDFTNPKREDMIKESLRKSAPSIVFLGLGFPEQEQWYADNRAFFSRAAVFGVDDSLDILSGMHRRAPDWMQLRGLSWLWKMMAAPWRVGDGLKLCSFLLRVSYRSLALKFRSSA